MSWSLSYAEPTARALKKLDRSVQRRILGQLQRLADLDDPTVRCKPLTGPLAGLWRYRVDDHRIIVDIQYQQLVIEALEIGHRSTIYRQTGG